jgi:hypothetical protein
VFVCTTLIVALAVYIRTAIRLAETAEWLLHFLSTREVIFGCLEFALILVAVYLLAAFHPGTFMELVYRGFEQVFNLKILAPDLTGIQFNAMIYDYLSCIGVSA